MSAATVKAALVTALAAAFVTDTRVLVSYGDPSDVGMDDLVAVMGVTAQPDGEEESFILDLFVRSYVGGGPEAQQTATERAFSLLGTADVAVNAAPTLGAACRVAAIDEDYVCEEAEAFSASSTPVGWVTTIESRVTARTGRALLGDLTATRP